MAKTFHEYLLSIFDESFYKFLWIKKAKLCLLFDASKLIKMEIVTVINNIKL